MNPRAVGIAGCVALAGAALFAAAVVFERAVIEAGVPYHFYAFAGLAFGLCAVAAVCGIWAWATPAGKAAVAGGLTLAAALAGFVALVMIAFG